MSRVVHARPASVLGMGLLLLLLSATVVQAKTVVLWLDGRTDPLTGELISETPNQVVLRIAGIKTTVDRNRIQRIEYELSLPEQYEQRRAALDDEDYEARYDLARWLFGKEQPVADRLAQRELRSLVEDNPDMRQAQLLLQLVNQRIEDRREREAAEEAAKAEREAETDAPAEGEGAGRPPRDGADEPGQPKYLTKAQRNLLKVMEINLEREPRVVVPRKTTNQFLETYRDSLALDDFEGRRGRARFKRMAGHEQLAVMFEAKAREFYDEVIVTTEPEPLQEFRQKWSRGLVAGHCGSCHNPRDNAPGLTLFTDEPASEKVAYTNFLILHRTQVGGRPMINRDATQRARSLLVQYALPRDDADMPHPEVEKFQPFLRGKQDPRYEQLINWIGKLYPSATYAIEYRLPWRGDEVEEPEAAPEETGEPEQEEAGE